MYVETLRVYVRCGDLMIVAGYRDITKPTTRTDKTNERKHRVLNSFLLFSMYISVSGSLRMTLCAMCLPCMHVNSRVPSCRRCFQQPTTVVEH